MISYRANPPVTHNSAAEPQVTTSAPEPIQSVSRETLTIATGPSPLRGRGRGMRWTPEHDATLRRLRLEEGVGVAEIAARMDRTKSAVQQRLSVLGIVVQPHRKAFSFATEQSYELDTTDPAGPRPGTAASGGGAPA
jgi:hypothetical protein